MLQLLPMEVLYTIFSYISIKERSRLRQVCKTWYSVLADIVVDPYLLRHLKLANIRENGISEHNLGTILTRTSSVETVDIFNCFGISGQVLEKAAAEDKFLNLKSLCISLTKIDDAILIGPREKQ